MVRPLHFVLSLVPMLAVALILSGCAARKTVVSAPPENLGKVHLRYQYTEADRLEPPRSFVVWRSESDGGPFEEASSEPVPALRDFQAGKVQLVLTDYGLPMGKTYYYYLERIGRNGVRTKVAPVTGAKVVLPMLPEDHQEFARVKELRDERREQGKRAGQLTSHAQGRS